MQLTFLGTSDAFETGLGHNSALIQFQNTNLAIDFPSTNHIALKRLGLGMESIEHVFISHTHEDHINGLQRLAYYQMIYYQNQRGINRKPHLYLHKDILDDLWQSLKTGLHKTATGRKMLDDYFEVHAIDDSFEINGQRFELVQTQHVPEMLSYGLYIPDKAYFSCDSTIDHAFLHEIKNRVNYIFHDSHLFDFHISAHAGYQDLKNLEPDIVEKLVLMHYDDRFNLKSARRKFNKKHGLELAEPLKHTYNLLQAKEALSH